MTLRDMALALVVVVAWGVNFVFIKWGVAEIPPQLMTALRYVVAALPAIFFVRPPKVKPVVLIAYGLTVGFAQFGLLFSAIKLGMPAGLASLVIQMQAFFTIGFAMLFLGERPGKFQLFGALVAIGGIAVIGVERFALTALVPLLMTVGAAFFWGLSNIATKKAGKIDMFAFVVWGSLVPILPLLALSLLVEGPEAIAAALTHLSARGIGSIAFVAYASTLVGYGLWSVLLSRYPASTVAPFSLLVPVAGILSTYLLLGETISALEIFGSVLVFLGLLLNAFGQKLFSPHLPRPVH